MVRLTRLVPLLVLVTAGQAFAFDLTGTWAGKWSCTGFDGAKFTSGNKESTLLVAQVGNVFSADIDGGEFRYNGGAIPDAAKPLEKGEAVMNSCGTDPIPLTGEETEIARLKVKVSIKPGQVKGSLKGVSIFEDNLGGVGTCKYSYKRITTTNPGSIGCPS